MAMARRGITRTILITLAAILMLSMALVGGASAAPQQDQSTQPEAFNAQVLQLVALRTGAPAAALEVSYSATASYPLSGQSAFTYKVTNLQTGDLYAISLDAAGLEVNTEDLLAAEEAAREARLGKIDPRLAEEMTGHGPDVLYKVAIWLKTAEYQGPVRPDIAPVGRLSTEAVESFLASTDAARSAFITPVVSPVVDRLAGMGFEASGDTYSPIVFATVPASAVVEIAKWDDVDTVYQAPVGEPDLEVSRPTTRADVVYKRNIAGWGVQVGVVEVGGRIATNNPWLAGVTQNGTNVCATAQAHTTGVTGIIRSWRPNVFGFAPGANVWVGGSCSGDSSQLTNRSTAAADWGARALNLSWGSNIGLTPGSLDRFYDDMVINRFRTVVKSAGNRDAPCASDGNVTSPGLGYNVITVGNFDDRNTVSWTDSGGDTIFNTCSSYKNPTSTNGDRNKPELAAPGTNINSTTTASPWTGNIGSGTSFAAPMVTAGVALLINRNSTLAVWPEVNKAILMTSAVHNIEGSARLSDRDGAGGLVLDRADDIARRANNQSDWGGQSYTCSAATNTTLDTIQASSGQRIRATIVFDNDPAYSSYASRPAADLELQILNAAGAVVAQSISYDNTYEIVDFTAPANGTYTMRVNKFRCSYSPRYLGWAWRIGGA